MKIYKTMSQQICKIYITDNPRKFAPTNLYDYTVCTGIQYPSYLMTQINIYLIYYSSVTVVFFASGIRGLHHLSVCVYVYWFSSSCQLMRKVTKLYQNGKTDMKTIPVIRVACIYMHLCIMVEVNSNVNVSFDQGTISIPFKNQRSS